MIIFLLFFNKICHFLLFTVSSAAAALDAAVAEQEEDGRAAPGEDGISGGREGSDGTLFDLDECQVRLPAEDNGWMTSVFSLSKVNVLSISSFYSYCVWRCKSRWWWWSWLTLLVVYCSVARV